MMRYPFTCTLTYILTSYQAFLSIVYKLSRPHDGQKITENNCNGDTVFYLMCDHLSFWVCPFFLMLFHKWNEYLWFNHWKDFTRKTTLLYSICLMGTILSYQPKTPKTYSFNNMKVHAHTANIFIRLKPVNWISGKQCLKLCNKYRSSQLL